MTALSNLLFLHHFGIRTYKTFQEIQKITWEALGDLMWNNPLTRLCKKRQKNPKKQVINL